MTDSWRVKWIDPQGKEGISIPRPREDAKRLAANLRRNTDVKSVIIISDDWVL